MSSISNYTSVDLDTFCRWFGQFHWCIGGGNLELPGQYTGAEKPNITHHINITKFAQKVQIFHTLRSPVKITILCSDGKSYDFLVKYGEDLRQDQRIQQLLTVMSEQLANDKSCRRQNLSVETYKVIPMDVYCGMLSWVDNTESIKQFLSDRLPNWKRCNDQVREDYLRFLNSTTQKEVYAVYGDACSTKTVNEVIHFNCTHLLCNKNSAYVFLFR